MEESALYNKNSEFLAVDKKSFEKLVTLVEELVINKVRIEQMKNEIQNNSYAELLEQEMGITSQVQHTMKKILMVKMKNIYDIVKNLVDSYCIKHQISVELILEGQDVEIESSSINIITDLLKYFIKNTFTNDFNAAEKKSYYIKVRTFFTGKAISISLESNGNSFDCYNFCKTLDKEYIEITSLNESDAYKLSNILDTKDYESNLINLRLELLSLCGSIFLEAEKDNYKKFKFIIPIATSIIQALLVNVSNQIYAIPLEDVETTMNKNIATIKHTNNMDFVVYMDHVIRLLNVSELLNIKPTNDESCILIVKTISGFLALLVDSLIDQTDVVVKPKPSILKNVAEYKDTTILGDGFVTLVLDVNSLTKNL